VDAPKNIENFDSSYAVRWLPSWFTLYRTADPGRRRERRVRSFTNTHWPRNICPGSVLIQMQMTSSSWPINTPPLSATPTLTSPLHRRHHRADRDTTRASSDLAQMFKPAGRHRLILPALNIRRSVLRRLLLGLGSGHYRTRSPVSSTYSTTVLLVSGRRRKPSPSTLTRAQQTFGCPQGAATAVVVNSTRFIAQRFAQQIKISPLPMWVHHSWRVRNLISIPSPLLVFPYFYMRPTIKGNRKGLGQSGNGCRFDCWPDRHGSSVWIRE
jgi:hypothetical protein